MDLDTLRQTLSALRQASICVVGDVCMDAYWTIDQSRSEESLETSLRTQPVREQSYFAGGGSNVAMNLKALGVGRVALFGVVGDDPSADGCEGRWEEPASTSRESLSSRPIGRHRSS